MDLDVGKFDIKEGQTVVIKMPVGPWGVMAIQEHCSTVIKAFKDEFDRNGMNVNLFAFPVSPGGVSPSLEVFEKPAIGSTIIMNVPVGGMPATDVPKYLKSVRDMTLIDWNKKFFGVKLQVFGMLEDGSKVELKVVE